MILVHQRLEGSPDPRPSCWRRFRDRASRNSASVQEYSSCRLADMVQSEIGSPPNFLLKGLENLRAKVSLGDLKMRGALAKINEEVSAD